MSVSAAPYLPLLEKCVSTDHGQPDRDVGEGTLQRTGSVPVRVQNQKHQDTGDPQAGAKAAAHSWDFFFLRKNLNIAFMVLQFIGSAPHPRLSRVISQSQPIVDVHHTCKMP